MIFDRFLELWQPMSDFSSKDLNYVTPEVIRNVEIASDADPYKSSEEYAGIVVDNW